MNTHFSKIFGAVFAAGALLFSSGVSAENCGDCCCSLCDLTDDWCVSGYIEVPIFEPCEETHIATVPNGTEDSLKYACWDWSVGVRTGLSFLLPCPNWALNIDYTWFSADGNETVSSAGHVAQIGGGTNGTSTRVDLDMDLHLIDLVISRDCCVCDTLQLNPYAGFRALLLDRDAKESSSGGVFTTAGDGGTSKQEYDGFGLTAGFNWKHCAFENVRFFGKFAGSVLVGEEDINLNRIHGGASVASVVDNNPCHTVGSIEAAAGFEYEHCFCDWNLHFTAAYEMTHWINISSLTPYEDGADDSFEVGNNYGSLGLHGVVLGVGFDF